MNKTLKLNFNLNFKDIFIPNKLKDIQDHFTSYLEQKDPLLYSKYTDYLANKKISYLDESLLLIDLSAILNDFMGFLFNIEKEVNLLKESYLEKDSIIFFKNKFIKRFVLPKQTKNENTITTKDFELLNKKIKSYYKTFNINHYTEEKKISELTKIILEAKNNLSKKILIDNEKQIQSISSDTIENIIINIHQEIIDFTYYILQSQRKLPKEKKWASFYSPKILQFDSLLTTSKSEKKIIEAEKDLLESRSGFKHTHHPLSQSHICGELDYCLNCHKTGKDSCSKGFVDPKNKEEIKINELSVPMDGCPMNQKISQSHTTAKYGNIIGALAIIMIDNPMCPGTGDRICNDCLTSCIFTRQESVAIPQNESAIVKDVIYKLPYGAEIYSLLTRWNPLQRKRTHMLPYNGKKVLIVGSGPAGYTLSHYLSNEGILAINIDALKLEPLPQELLDENGDPTPIKNFKDLTKNLDERTIIGFGGVSEYGITVRWDKNLLLLLYITLSRKNNIKFYGGVRFGSNLNLEDAWSMGFDHIALASGAGKPNDLSIKENMPPGVSKASDFLMTLQSNGAFKKDNLSVLDIKLPAVIIGGGLTAVDTATEVLHYYPIFVEKLKEQHDFLKKHNTLECFHSMLNPSEKKQFDLYLSHSQEIKKEKNLAKKENREVNFLPLLNKWGGVTLAYRKEISYSPAYRLSSYELQKALNEGIKIIPSLTPQKFIQNDQGITEKIEFTNDQGESIIINSLSTFIATGTSPNSMYEKEYPGTFEIDNKNFFKTHVKSPFFTTYEKDEKHVSFFGDLHPQYVGNVAKAMASSKYGYIDIVKQLEDTHHFEKSLKEEKKYFDDHFITTVHDIKRLSLNITEITLKNKLAAINFKPGQFFKIQNFESFSQIVNNTKLLAEPIALTGSSVNKEKGLVSSVLLEVGASTKVISTIKKKEPIVCMGPTGTPTYIPENKNIILIGGGLGNAVLFSILKEAKIKNNKIIYFSAYKKYTDIIYLDILKKNSDELIVSCDENPSNNKLLRNEDIFHGNVLESIKDYTQNKNLNLFSKSEHLIVIGSSNMMKAIKNNYGTLLKPVLPNMKSTIASINSSMQCMSKAICGRCIQKHQDPLTNKTTYVYSCFNQDQPMEHVDFNYLNHRLQSNSIGEKLINSYTDLLLKNN